ncbi:unnamed protein product [Durusdinium trenchii]|uniref:Uncharacterized protein n=1 Tax=Durusdinium trenchii TaxID=1381693 RepID=A0ABP0SL50_9DINO
MPQWQPGCDDFDGTVVNALNSRDVEVGHTGVHCNTGASFPANPRMFEWHPSASEDPCPTASCTVVAQWVKSATAPTGAFSKRQRKPEAAEHEDAEDGIWIGDLCGVWNGGESSASVGAGLSVEHGLTGWVESAVDLCARCRVEGQCGVLLPAWLAGGFGNVWRDPGLGLTGQELRLFWNAAKRWILVPCWMVGFGVCERACLGCQKLVPLTTLEREDVELLGALSGHRVVERAPASRAGVLGWEQVGWPLVGKGGCLGGSEFAEECMGQGFLCRGGYVPVGLHAAAGRPVQMDECSCWLGEPPFAYVLQQCPLLQGQGASIAGGELLEGGEDAVDGLPRDGRPTSRVHAGPTVALDGPTVGVVTILWGHALAGHVLLIDLGFARFDMGAAEGGDTVRRQIHPRSDRGRSIARVCGTPCMDGMAAVRPEQASGWSCVGRVHGQQTDRARFFFGVRYWLLAAGMAQGSWVAVGRGEGEGGRGAASLLGDVAIDG